MKILNIALVGFGNIGKRHASLLTQIEGYNLLAICEMDESKHLEISEKYKGINLYSKFEDLIERKDIDIVTIATPHFTHANLSIAALNSGINVLVEKPMAIKEKDCIEMAEAAELNDVKLWVVKQNRYNVPIKLANNAIKAGLLGKLYLINVDVLWNRSEDYYSNSIWRGIKEFEGGALFTQASHFVDLLIWWAGEFSNVESVISNQKHNIEIEDSGSSIITFNNGAIGNLCWTNNVKSENFEGSITVIAEKGTIKIGGKYLNKLEYWDVEDTPIDTNEDFNDTPNKYSNYTGSSSNHDKVYKDIIQDYFSDNNSNLVFGREGALSVNLINAIYKSAKRINLKNEIN